MWLYHQVCGGVAGVYSHNIQTRERCAQILVQIRSDATVDMGRTWLRESVACHALLILRLK